MAIRLGMNAKLYLNGNEVGNCRDLTLNLETATADVTTRGNDGWRATVATLKDATVEFEMLADSEDSDFAAVQAAFLGNTTLDVAVLDGDDGEGLQFTGMVTSFSRSEQLEEAIAYSVTLQPTYSETPPQWITGGYS